MAPDLLNLILAAVVVGGALYLFNLMPIDGTIKKVASTLVIVVAIIWAIKWLIGHGG